VVQVELLNGSDGYVVVINMSSFWVDACASAQNRPLQTLLDAARGSCWMTVRGGAAAAAAAAVLWRLVSYV
jgi:hypothetical protein